MPSSYTKKDFEKLLNNLQTDSSWKDTHGFQEDVIINATQRLKKRLEGWMNHERCWSEDPASAEGLQKAWNKFEKKHLTAYWRWRKNSGANGGFEEKTAQGLDLDKRFKNLFLYYLTYGEVHDCRNLKGPLNMFYQAALDKFEKNEAVGKYLREQGAKVYKFLSVIYSKDEMLQYCFHHDDFDPICTSKSFVKKFLGAANYDLLAAFDLVDEGKGKWPSLCKLLKLDAPTVTKYWVKGAQGGLSETDRNARDEWIKANFINPGGKEDTELSDLRGKFTAQSGDIEKADRVQNQSEEQLKNNPEHFRPSEEDYDDKPGVFLAFRSAHTQYETSKDLIANADLTEKDAKQLLREARVGAFRDEKKADKLFGEAERKFASAQRDYEEAAKGFSRAADGFKNIADCESFGAECRFLRDRAEYLKLIQARAINELKYSRVLQLQYGKVMDKERLEFANKFKTYFEKAGGPFGMWAYLTILYHFSQVIYLHLFLVLPLSWLYFDYHNLIDTNNFGASIQNLVSMDTLMDPSTNVILPWGAAIALIIIFILLRNLVFRWRLRGYGTPGRGDRTPLNVHLKGRFDNFLLWIILIVTEVIIMRFLVLKPLREAEIELRAGGASEGVVILLLVIIWLPALILYVTSMQFFFTFWIGIFGFIYGLWDRVGNSIFWSDVISAFEVNVKSVKKGKDDEEVKVYDTPVIVKKFVATMLPAELELDEQRQNIAFAQMWNTTMNYFYDIHKISKDELQRFTYKIKNQDPEDYLSGEVEKLPELTKEPAVKEMKYHITRFVNNIRMSKPNKHIAVKEMLPLNIVTPVGAEKIMYPYEFITHVDNTQNSFLMHLINKSPQEWENFKRKECITPKSLDWAFRLEKDIMQGIQPEVKSKREKKKWIHDTTEGRLLKRKLCEWGSIRFQALFRTVNGLMQIPKALEVLARIEDAKLSQSDAEEMVRTKFSYLMGYQSFSKFLNLYKKSKKRGKSGEPLSRDEIEAHDAVYNIKYLKARFPELKIAYPETEGDQWFGRLTSGLSKTNSNYYDYKIELFGPFADLGLGKPVHQNFLSQFIDGMVIQAIDVNQDNVISQSFFIPNVLSNFDDDKVKIIGLPEFVLTTGWSSTAWCSAFGERTFGTLTQRTYARMGLRLHYGHPDYLDAIFVMTETGMSKMSYVSEDIFTGIDTVIKGGNIIHVEYHEVGKARDVDLYTTTKFQRKISMGASQMSSSRWMGWLMGSKNVSYFQSLSFYYSTVGFYLNHQMLYLSIWFTLVSQFVLVILQIAILGDQVTNFISNRVFFAQIGYALVAPGILQLVLEKGIIKGVWDYISHFFILAVYSTFHILNISAFWQFGLKTSAFYLASGRGTGLEHYFMKDMYDNFYKSHWRPGFVIFWMGIIVFAISVDFFVFILMYMAPAGVWLWGAMFLNPGSLPTTVHEEQWKRLTNRDMQEVSDVVRQHSKLDVYQPPVKGNIVKRFFVRIGRGIRSLWRALHYIYTVVNFAIQMRIVRLIAVLATFWENIMASRIPTYIFVDERRRVLRWEEEENRTQSVFYSMNSDRRSSVQLTKPVTATNAMNAALDRSDDDESESSGRPLGDAAQAQQGARPLPSRPPAEKRKTTFNLRHE